MKLTVLGGSAAAPNPGDACAGYVVSSDDTALLLDCGPGVVAQLRGTIDPRSLSGIVITHLHADHTLDLVALRYTLKYAPFQSRSDRVPLYLPPGGLAFLDRFGAVFQSGNEVGQDFWGDVLAPTEYDPDAPLAVGSYAIRFEAMTHYIPAWAVRIENGRAAMVFSADTGPRSGLTEFARGSELLLCEATLLEQPATQSPEEYGHLTAAEAGAIAWAAGVPRLVLTHLWGELGFERLLEDASAAFHGPVARAHSGAVFEF